MECLIVIFVGIGILIFLSARSPSGKFRSDWGSRAYRALAQRHGGSYFSGKWGKRSQVTFRYGRTNVAVDNYSQRGLRTTRICLDWPDRALRFDIFPLRMASGSLADWEKQGAEIVSPPFSRRFAINAANSEQLRSFLSEGVQWQIERLRTFLGTDEVGVSVVRGQLSIKKLTLIHQFQQLDEFTLLALELFDQAMLTREKGIEFVQDNQSHPITEALCQVCGEDIVDQMVFCRRCKTPHHLDCWQYYGACSTYGCQEVKYVVP